MTNARCVNFIHKEDIEPISTRIYFWGWISLICIFYPRIGGVKYKIISNQKEVFETNYIDEAIDEYNKLVAAM